MDQPTLKPVRATGRGHTVEGRTALIGLASAAIVFVGLAWAAPSPGRRAVDGAPPQSIQATNDERTLAVVNEATAPPSRSPTPDVAWVQTFTSDLFDYTLRYPDGWTTRAATRADLSDWVKAPLP